MLKDIRWGVGAGLAFAFVYSLVAVGIYAFGGAEAFEANNTTLTAVIAAYFGGGIIAGVLVGLLRPLAKKRAGAMLVGVVAAVPVFVGFALAIWGWPSEWGEGVLFAILISAVPLGAWAGYTLWEPPAQEESQSQ